MYADWKFKKSGLRFVWLTDLIKHMLDIFPNLQWDPQVAPNIENNHNLLHWGGRSLTRTKCWEVLSEKESQSGRGNSSLTNVNFYCSLDIFYKRQSSSQTPIHSGAHLSKSGCQWTWSCIRPSEADPEPPCSDCSQPQECPSFVPWVATVFFQSVHMTSELTSRVNCKVKCSLNTSYSTITAHVLVFLQQLI